MQLPKSKYVVVRFYEYPIECVGITIFHSREHRQEDPIDVSIIN